MKDITCPYCKAVAVIPPSRDPDVDYLWILHADSPLKKLEAENKQLMSEINSLGNIIIDSAGKGYVSSNDLDRANDAIDMWIQKNA